MKNEDLVICSHANTCNSEWCFGRKSHMPSSEEVELRLEKTPFGIPVCWAALIIAEAINSPVPRCIG